MTIRKVPVVGVAEAGVWAPDADGKVRFEMLMGVRGMPVIGPVLTDNSLSFVTLLEAKTYASRAEALIDPERIAAEAKAKRMEAEMWVQFFARRDKPSFGERIDWPHTRASWARLKTAAAGLLRAWANRIAP